MTQPIQLTTDECEMLTILRSRIGFPPHYFVFDCETTGGSPEKDLLTQVGWGVVVDRQLVDNTGLILDWTRHPGVDQHWLFRRLNELQDIFARSGRTYAVSYDRMRREGEDPIEVLKVVYTLLCEYIHRGEWIVGHNAWQFERDLFDGSLQRWLPHLYVPWQPNSIFDTGLFEKAMQNNRPPYQGESLDEWYDRANKAKTAGVHWNLDKHCVEKYRLAERYGLDMAHAHDAGFDCRLTHYLFETFRHLAETVHANPTWRNF